MTYPEPADLSAYEALLRNETSYAHVLTGALVSNVAGGNTGESRWVILNALEHCVQKLAMYSNILQGSGR